LNINSCEPIKRSQSLFREALYNSPFIFQKYVWILKVIGKNSVVTKTISDNAITCQTIK